ncbi:YeeE/YedE family protein [Bradyrhizobium sp. CCBAU 53415]|uniref:YeeE/YedE family protein n=1 Tax=Bradyrhizobium sp. CCBAU 53415 TaxID=1325119 RepID=UPI0023061EAD|nr:YeeE/YedE family protein [Bradyrhizobium sp. CCBAU 53415]MDA9467006.1 lipocalin [Bradyrhizobium sp. CCBAU 53415]
MPTPIIDLLGEDRLSWLGGLLVGGLFGFFAQRSRFCLRAAAVEFSRGEGGPRLAVWLLTFAAALVGTQALVALGWLDVSEARQLAQQGSISGALAGGVMFGCGMILARGCASRLLVLSANGNLRALLSGLVFAVTAQAAYRGLLSPAREWVTNLWLVDGGPSRDIMAMFGAGTPEKLAFGSVWLIAGLSFAFRSRLPRRLILAALATGAAVVTGWLFTYQLSQASFVPVTLKSLTFSGPSAELLMLVLNSSQLRLGFDLGIIPGVFLGSFAAAARAGELKLEGFSDGLGMRRYLVGAVLMGFGAMLAGGCAVGAGVTGASVFALTAWLVLAGMWLGAGLTDLLVDRAGMPRPHQAANSPASGA